MENETPYAPETLDFDNTFVPKTDSLLGQSTYVMEYDAEVIDESTVIDRNESTTHEAQKSLIKSYLEETKIEPVVFRQKEKEPQQNTTIPKVSFSPAIKTVMTEKKIVEQDDFSINAWAEFQMSLKSNFLVLKTEYQLKQKVIEELNHMIKEYYTTQLKIRENDERIKKKLSREDIVEEEVIRVILDDKDNTLGDATLYAKTFLSLIYDQPKILATIVKHYTNASALKILEETLCTTFYHDIISEDAYDEGLLLLLRELLEGEFAKANKHTDLFLVDNFTNKMCTTFLKRRECKRYSKIMLKNPLIATIREKHMIQLNPEDILKQIENKQRLSKGAVCVFRADSRKSYGEILGLTEEYKRKSTSRMSSDNIDDGGDVVNAPVLVLKRHKSEESLLLEETKIEARSSSNLELRNASIIKPVKNPEVTKILDRSFHLIKKYLSRLIQSIFDSLQSMPIGLRILCKVIYQLAQKKFPNLGAKEYNEILFAYLFRKWISPMFISPVHNGIIDDFPSTDVSANNLMEIAKVLQVVFSQNIYPAEDVKAALNPYILEIQPSVAKFYQELVATNGDLLTQAQVITESSRIKSRAICISLKELQLLCEAIHQYKEHIVPVCSDALILAEKLLYYSQEHRIFSDKHDSGTGKKLKSHQLFFLFNELIYPSSITANYLEEFNKIPGFSKNLPEQEKVLYRARHLLKQFLVSIQDMKSIIKLREHENIRLDDVLEKYQDKLYSYQLNQSTKEQMPLHVTARFLATTLQDLDASYADDNYYKLYQEMFLSLKELTDRLDFSISTTKLQLLNALDNLKRSCKAMHEINEKKIKTIEKSAVKEFIWAAHIPCCITSPSIMKKLEDSVSKKKSKKKTLAASTGTDNEEIVLRDIKGCLHEKTAIKEPTGSSSKKEKAASQDNAAILHMSHCDTIDGFINVFGDLAEVRDAMVTGKDRHGVNRAMITYYTKVEIALRMHFKNLTEEKLDIMMNKLENYITKRLYTRIFPLQETEADKRFYKRCKLLEWTNYDHLEVIARNRCTPMWEYAADILNEIDNKPTPLEKLNCIVECAKTVTQVLELASTKESGGGADETLPIILYVLLLAAPKRIHSNINFITLLRDNQKMQAREGYCFTQIVSAVMTIEAIDHRFYKMKEEEFVQTLLEKEILYGFHRQEASPKK